jgi:hypothetical protein
MWIVKITGGLPLLRLCTWRLSAAMSCSVPTFATGDDTGDEDSCFGGLADCSMLL